MLNSFNPYGGVNPLIDKVIGNAYEIVKYVARYLREIRYVAENMQYVFAAANGNAHRAKATANSASLSIPLPATVDLALLQAVTVMANVGGGTYYFPGKDTFNFGISGGNVVISIGAVVPALTTAEYTVVATTYLADEG